jgi:hypothetical protein
MLNRPGSNTTPEEALEVKGEAEQEHENLYEGAITV